MGTWLGLNNSQALVGIIDWYLTQSEGPTDTQLSLRTHTHLSQSEGIKGFTFWLSLKDVQGLHSLKALQAVDSAGRTYRHLAVYIIHRHLTQPEGPTGTGSTVWKTAVMETVTTHWQRQPLRALMSCLGRHAVPRHFLPRRWLDNSTSTMSQRPDNVCRHWRTAAICQLG